MHAFFSTRVPSALKCSIAMFTILPNSLLNLKDTQVHNETFLQDMSRSPEGPLPPATSKCELVSGR